MEMYGAGGCTALARQAGQRTPVLGLQPRTTPAAGVHTVGPGPHACKAFTWIFEVVSHLAQADLTLTGLILLILLPPSSTYEDYKCVTRPGLIMVVLY